MSETSLVPASLADETAPQGDENPDRWLRPALNAFVAVLAATLLAVLWQAIFLPTLAQNWFGGSTQIPAAQIVVVQGRAGDVAGKLKRVTPQNAVAIIELPVTLIALESQPMVHWFVQRANDKTEVSLQWTSGTSSFEQPLLFKSNRRSQEVSFQRDPRWLGTVASVRLVARGDAPIDVGHLTIRADSVRARLQLMWEGWFGFRPWAMSDLNFIEATDATETYYFNPTVIAAITLVFLIYLTLRWASGKRVDPRAVLLIFIAGWIVGDIRWQVDLFQKTADSVRRFGGKSLHEKHLAADDHEYYWAIHTLAPTVSKDNNFSQPFVLHFNKDERYDRGKLTYYAAPNPLQLLTTAPVKGQMFAIVNMPFSFDPTTQTLIFGEKISVRAELIAQRGVAQVFRAL